MWLETNFWIAASSPVTLGMAIIFCRKLDRLLAAQVDLVENFLMVRIGHFAAFLSARPRVDQSDFKRGMISRAIVST